MYGISITRFGSGKPYDREIISAMYTRDISSLSLSTSLAVTGHWQFSQDEGNQYIYINNEGNHYI